MRRFLKHFFLSLGILLLIVVGTAWYLLNDQDFLKKKVGGLVGEYTGRTLSISGPLEIQLGKVTHISVGGVRFSNAQWAGDKDMARVGRAEVSVDIPSLFGGSPFLPVIALENCHVHLARQQDGSANWHMLPKQPSEPDEIPSPKVEQLPFRVDDLSIADCALQFDDAGRKPLRLALERLRIDIDDAGKVRTDAKGDLNGESLSWDGWYGPYGVFYLGGRMEHEFQLGLGQVTLNSKGSLEDASNWTGANIDVRFQGPEIGNILELFSAPPLSEGAFDFHVGLNSQGEFTRLRVDGDLGSLDAQANGEVDRLVRPTKGQVKATIEGPNLDALGQTVGIEGLLPEPYRLDTEVVYAEDRVRIEQAEFGTENGTLVVSGEVTFASDLAGSDIEFRLESDEIGRWAPVARQKPTELGWLTVEGRARFDHRGVVSIDTRLENDRSRLEASGEIGRLKGPIEPALQVDFQSSDTRRIAALAGLDEFPIVPGKLSGNVDFREQKILLDEVNFELGENKGRVDTLYIGNRMAGSELDVLLDVPDIADLGLWFGIVDLPSQAVKLTANLQPVGKGLVFKVGDGNLGDIQIELDGQIADLDQPLGVDAAFDISLPNLEALELLLPGVSFPKTPMRAHGDLKNEFGNTRLQDVSLVLGDIQASLNGKVAHDGHFDLATQITGPDASVPASWAGQKLLPEPFSFESTVSGGPDAINARDLQARLGSSQVEGQLDVGLGDITTIRGSIHSTNLDLSQWNTGDEAPGEPPPEAESEFVFDERPIPRLADYGVDIDLDLTVDSLNMGNTYIREIELGLVLNPQLLQLDPFQLRGEKGGLFAGNMTLDDSGVVPALDLILYGKDVRIGIMSTEDQPPETYPSGEIDIKLSGSGATRRAFASGMNGHVRLFFGSGQVASAGVGLLFGDFITELFNTLNPFAKTSEYTNLECAVIATDIVSGQVDVSPVIMQTEQLTILTQGSIDLDTEKLELTFNTKPRQGLGLSTGVLINSLVRVGGRLKSPAVELDPANTVVTGGVAVATVGLSLLAKSMSDRFLSSKDPCGDARKELAKRDSGAGD